MHYNALFLPHFGATLRSPPARRPPVELPEAVTHIVYIQRHISPVTRHTKPHPQRRLHSLDILWDKAYTALGCLRSTNHV